MLRPLPPSLVLPAALALLLVSAAFQPAQAQQFGPPEPKPELPPPYQTRAGSFPSRVIGWPEGKLPTAPPGFRVNLYAELEDARWPYVLPNGDVLVAQSDSGRITLFRGLTAEGRPAQTEVFLKGLNRPFGMLVLDGSFYLGETNKLSRYTYGSGQTQIDPAQGKRILDLPAGGYNNHWTRNVVARPDGKKLLVTVGSASNAGEYGLDKETRRAGVLEINPDGTGERVFASGLRNPVGIDFAPGTGVPWTVVNERDNLGDDLVPDYLTSVRDGGFYGWPFAYFGQNEDPRLKGQRPDLVAKSLKPDYALGSHTASLGLTFYRGKSFPERYRRGVFIGQRGSWNRSQLAGYKVAFVPFDENGKPTGKPPEEFLGGFVADLAKREVYGRPVGVTTLPDGSLLVCDEPGNRVWRVSYGR